MNPGTPDNLDPIRRNRRERRLAWGLLLFLVVLAFFLGAVTHRSSGDAGDSHDSSLTRSP